MDDVASGLMKVAAGRYTEWAQSQPVADSARTGFTLWCCLPAPLDHISWMDAAFQGQRRKAALAVSKDEMNLVLLTELVLSNC
jgi:hypothetical protein